MNYKICNVCKQSLQITEYHKRSSGRVGYMTTCKKCTSIRASIRYKEKKEHIQEIGRKWREKQREEIHGNFELYFKRLVKRVKTISAEDCLDIYKQQKGLCAISGVPLTCIVGKLGEHPKTNASIDRIIHGEHGGQYTKENVRLVCAIVNSMRLNQSDEELLWWSHQIIQNSQRNPNGRN